MSVYYDRIREGCRYGQEEEEEKGCQAASEDGVFTINTASFVVSDDLHIFPVETGLLGIILYRCG